MLFIVAGGTSLPLTRICSIELRCAPSSISSSFCFNSSVKSLEVRDFPSTLSTLVLKVASNPAILLC
jgi:hypothetical protein